VENLLTELCDEYPETILDRTCPSMVGSIPAPEAVGDIPLTACKYSGSQSPNIDDAALPRKERLADIHRKEAALRSFRIAYHSRAAKSIGQIQH
jgi:hypothetical protein